MNGMPLVQQTNISDPGTAIAYLKQSGINLPVGTTHQEIMNLARAVANQAPNMTKQQLHNYKQNLAVQQSQQGLAGRQPMGAGGALPAGQQATIPFANPGMQGGMNFAPHPDQTRAPTQAEMAELSNQAKVFGGNLSHPPQGSHSLQDYQNQLMVLETQNKKRLQHARQETNNRSDEPGSGPMNGQFPQQAGPGLQPGHQIQGTSMSPSNSRTGPSPQIANLELQRKAGQKSGSVGASPEPGEPVGPNRGPSPAFPGPGGGITHEQIVQMTGQLGGPAYGQPVMINGQPQFMPGRPHPGMQLNQQGNPMAYEMMMKQGNIPRHPPGQPYPPGWPQQMINQQMAQVRILKTFTDLKQMRQGMGPGQVGPQGPTPQQQMPPPPQPQQPQPARQAPAPNESPSTSNAQPPTPTPANKPAPKTKNTKEGGRAKRNRGKGAAAPATPNASEPPTPTTPITPLPPAPFGNNQNQSQNPQAQAQSQQQQQQQQPPEQPAQTAQDAPPSAFSAIDNADGNTDSWTNIDDKWMSPMDFASSFSGALEGFPGSSFGAMGLEDEGMVNYSEFLNDNDGLNMDLTAMWSSEDLTGTEA